MGLDIMFDRCMKHF